MKVEWSTGAWSQGAPEGTSPTDAVLHWQPNGAAPVVVTSRCLLRTYTQEAFIRCLRAVVSLRLWKVYGAFDANVPLSHPKAWRMMVVLQKCE
jgi:hypothetical protein